MSVASQTLTNITIIIYYPLFEASDNLIKKSDKNSLKFEAL